MATTAFPKSGYPMTAKQQPIAHGYRGGTLSINTQVEDSMTPEINMYTDLYKKVLPVVLQKMGRDLKVGVYQQFKQTQSQTFNSTVTTKAKGYKPPLVYSGRLRDAMSDVDNGIQTIIEPTRMGVSVTWDIPETGGSPEFPGSRQANEVEYMWFHEHGASMTRKLVFDNGRMTIKHENWRLRARPFFFTGLNKGRIKALATLQSSVNAYFLAHMQDPRYRPRITKVDLKPQNIAPTSAAGALWFAAPPSKLYSYLGIWGDFLGVLSGALFSERAIIGYARQMAYGQMGYTRKTVRRRVRRRIWERK